MHLFVDGTNVVHRAFYALAGPRLDRAGDPADVCQVARGWITRWQHEYHVDPQHVLIACDGQDAAAPRRAIFPAYKMRGTKHPVLAAALAQWPALVLGTDWSFRSGARLEADDLIAQAAEDAAASGISALIYTTDRDLLQCLSHNIVLVRYDTSANSDALWTVERFINHYGFRPASLADYKALAGDPSDGLAGVPGIGVVTAARLLGHYTTLEGIRDNLDAITPLRIQTILRRGLTRAFGLRLITRLPFQQPTAADLAALREEAHV
jgi:DNA polymerase-1